MRAPRLLRLPSALIASFALAATLTLATATPSAAYEFEGSGLESAIASTVDVAIVRPLASVRVLVGGVLMIPATILGAPGGSENLNDAYDRLVAEPMEFAFDRKLGEF